MTRFQVVCALIILLSGCWALATGCGGDDDESTDSGLAPDDDDASSPTPADDDDNNDDTAGQSAQVLLPSYPYWPNDAIFPDPAHLEELATEYCLSDPADAATDEFFFGWLPMRAFDLFFAESAAVPLETLLGDLYLSGFFGGVWLRSALASASNSGVATDDSFAQLRWIFTVLTRIAAGQLDLIRQGENTQVLSAARQHLNILLFIYAYNLGYIRQIIQNPPPGAADFSEWLVCNGDQMLDCASPVVDFPFLDCYSAALVKLSDPPNMKWEQMAQLEQSAERFIDQGEWVWRMIDISGLSPEVFELLVRLSLNFLLASRGSALGNMTCWADGLPAEGRYSLRLDMGMVIWSGSYFMGLTAGTNELPELICSAEE